MKTDTELKRNNNPRDDDLLDHMARSENQAAARLLRNVSPAGHAVLEEFFRSVRKQRSEQ